MPSKLTTLQLTVITRNIITATLNQMQVKMAKLNNVFNLCISVVSLTVRCFPAGLMGFCHAGAKKLLPRFQRIFAHFWGKGFSITTYLFLSLNLTGKGRRKVNRISYLRPHKPLPRHTAKLASPCNLLL